ncbi:MAG: hypothetical protein CMC70_09395 [Flavobacteriaceae bacterium]|nr:hypothetical protein [Flavobacteriaceae bacterium]
MGYCHCGEYIGLYGDFHPECKKIIQILELYGKEKVLNVLEISLLRNEKQIDKKLEFLGELKTKIEKKN